MINAAARLQAVDDFRRRLDLELGQGSENAVRPELEKVVRQSDRVMSGCFANPPIDRRQRAAEYIRAIGRKCNPISRHRLLLDHHMQMVRGPRGEQETLFDHPPPQGRGQPGNRGRQQRRVADGGKLSFLAPPKNRPQRVKAARRLGNEGDMGKPCGQTMLLAKFKTRLESKVAHRLSFEPKSGDLVEPPGVADENSRRRHGKMVVKIATEYSAGFEQSIIVLPIDEQQEARALDRPRGEDHFPRLDREAATVKTLSRYGAEPSTRLQRKLADSRPEPNFRAALGFNVFAKERGHISIDERRPFGEARHKSGVGAWGAS